MVQPETATVLFWKMSHNYSSYYPQGAGLITQGGVIISSTGFNFLSNMFDFFVVALLLYAYIKVQIVQPTAEIIRARRFLIIAAAILSIYTIIVLPWFTFIPLPNALVLITLVIVSYIAFRVPEGLLLSHVQILRAIGLYKEMKVLSSEQATKRYGSHSLVEYLQNIPPELIGYTWETLEQLDY
ncbi:MAG: hypothetical protein JSW11_15135 [Candidatus Heimdallarchaeota archaeon]|nr:MAG: hypothetical protein JSW11_15135 [Candidatus Heimdallarchaeota archaeon]